MTVEAPGADPRERSFAVVAHTRASRAASLALEALAAANLLYLGWSLVLDFLHGTEHAPPVPVALGLLAFSGVPLLLASVLGRAVSGSLSVEAEALVLSMRRERFEIPAASLAGVRLLAFPRPAPGLLLELRSGRRFPRSLGAVELAALLAALAPHLPRAEVEAARAHPAVAFAEALPRKPRRARAIIGLVILPLAISAIVFRLHQHIVYGGTFGQYHAMGLGPYLESFFMRWLGIAGVFVALAGVLRFVTEGAIYGATRLWPGHGLAIRRALEAASLVAYFGGVPGYVALRLLAG